MGRFLGLFFLYLSSLIMGRSEKVDFDKKTIVFNESFRSFLQALWPNILRRFGRKSRRDAESYTEYDYPV